MDAASPLMIMDKALESFGDDIAIAFSGAEDVALIEYAHLTGRKARGCYCLWSSSCGCRCSFRCWCRQCRRRIRCPFWFFRCHCQRH